MRESPRTFRQIVKIKSVGLPDEVAQNLPNNLNLHGKRTQPSPKHVLTYPISEPIFGPFFGPENKHRPSVTDSCCSILWKSKLWYVCSENNGDHAKMLNMFRREFKTHVRSASPVTPPEFQAEACRAITMITRSNSTQLDAQNQGQGRAHTCPEK